MLLTSRTARVWDTSNLPARSQHNRAVSLPVFAQQENGNQNGVQQQRRGHQYQSSFSGLGNGNGFSNGYGLAIQDNSGMNMNGLNGWAEEEIVGN